MTGGGFRAGFSSAELEPGDYEPVASEFYGLRAFVVDEGSRRWAVPGGSVDPAHNTNPEGFPHNGGISTDPIRGALRGIFRCCYVWGSGVNTAVCVSGSIPNRRAHQAVADFCGCGFWAFTRGRHHLSAPGYSVLGIVQGWGRMVIGPHGFRSEKARLVALTLTPQRRIGDEQKPRDNEVRRFSVGHVTDVLNTLAGSASSGATDEQRRAALERVAKARLGFGGKDIGVRPDLGAAVTKLYPDAQIFPHAIDMLQAFPLTDLDSLLPPAPKEET